MLPNKQLKNILLEQNAVTKEQLDIVTKRMSESDEQLYQVLLNMGFMSEEQLVNALVIQTGFSRLDLKKQDVNVDLLKLFPESFILKNSIFPISLVDETLIIAMEDPLDIYIMDDIKNYIEYEIEPKIATPGEIDYLFNTYLHSDGNIEEFIEEIELVSEDDEVNDDEVKELEQLAEKAPIIGLVNEIIITGVRLGASDIHIEPAEDTDGKVRYRIDGVLQEKMSIPRNIYSPVVSRIKVMADLDIAESRKPQDGRITLKTQNKKVNLRISTLPTIAEEKVVIRILNQQNVSLDFSKLGFQTTDKQLLKEIINLPHGMILLTGPTGSGKTTTLYTALKTLDAKQKNIVTIEDPVEYRFEDISQIQLNTKLEMTFNDWLKHIVRQDPDVIMLGEIRDKETADTAIHSALTGHLVFSTLHTNSAIGAVTRLIDMGINPFLIASSVVAVIGQRLVRTICPECKTKNTSDSRENSKNTFYGEGCDSCENTGYKGRTVVYEILPMSSKIQELINERASESKIKEIAKKEGMRTIYENGLEKIKEGVTTYEEVTKVTKNNVIDT